jgi:hypothetical protein
VVDVGVAEVGEEGVEVAEVGVAEVAEVEVEVEQFEVELCTSRSNLDLKKTKQLLNLILQIILAVGLKFCKKS